MMASPTAIKALSRRLEFQLDEANISLDPLVDSDRDRLSANKAGGSASDFAGTYRLSGYSGSGSRGWNALVQQNGEVTFG